ncbi:MAG: hypothetical protein INQ03_24220 [Candidatus Heimdallarchaeota archaeon]|nr:hypothetical protein [Candidatus Heimdallarchaeota archaeon]
MSLMLSQGTYIVNEEIVMLRSQYNDESITIDGELTESIWARAGSVILNSGSGVNATQIIIRFMNDFESLYFGISITSDSVINNTLGLFFDTDGDGSLSAPEDAKVISYVNSTRSILDLHWDDGWKQDVISSGDDDEFVAATKLESGVMYYEIEIALVSSNLPYDGWQIASPVNTYIAFTAIIVNRLDDNAFAFNYPTNSTDVAGYVDLRLAGPEDQDLPEYIPPTYATITTEDTQYDEYYGDGALGLDAPSNIGISLLMFGTLAYIRRRRR